MKIVIVGGGSAGWMSASILIKAFPEYDITLVESSDIPTIGVGESTINGIAQYCKYLEIDEKDFLKYTDGSYKIAIKFKDFDSVDSNSFLYPFGIPATYGTSMGLQDWMIKKYCYPETPLTDFAESYFPAAIMAKHNVFFKNENYKIMDTYNSNIGIAYHFDAGKFAEWLKIKYAIPRGVKHIVSEVEKIDSSEENIKSITLKNKTNITADLFVDCTGFSSLLLEKTLKEEFIDYSDMLPNNKAWATRIPYKNKEAELDSVTTCTAISNGWVWNIPLWSRLGAGYVYSDKFITKEDALEEFKMYLQSSNVKIPRTKEEVDSFEYKEISIKTGIHKRCWVGNTVAIGLSAGFIEPLESSGLYTVHEFLFQLVRALSRGTPSAWDKEAYNISTFRMFNEFAEFVAMHYAFTKRTDSDYWKSIFNKNFYSTSKDEVSFFSGIIDSKTRTSILPPRGGYPWILVGMGYLTLDNISAALGEMEHYAPYSVVYEEEINYLNIRKEHWETVIKNQTSLYEYLEKNIYSSE